MSLGDVLPAIFGCAGPSLSDEERDLFQAARPAGFILFARNCETAAQIEALTEELGALAPVDPAPILIDQEGGRVARLRPPLAKAHPPAAAFGSLYARDSDAAREAVRLTSRALAAELLALGITVDCLPLLDIPQPGADNVIGDRAYADDVERVTALGGGAAEALIDAGVVPVMKHIPGHGRATVDSHKALPIVETPRETLEDIDCAPFRALRDLPMAMTAHVVYRAIDPALCATLSPVLIEDVIRGHIGFSGLLMSDDISMGALAGAVADRAAAAIAAGCDVVLHCNGDLEEMEAIAARLDAAPARVVERLTRAMSAPKSAASGIDVAALVARRDALLGAT